MIDLPIGMKLVEVEDDGFVECNKCVIPESECIHFKCTRQERIDKKNVHFELLPDTSTVQKAYDSQQHDTGTIIDTKA